MGREFIIRSDKKSLKELLQQVVQTPDQQLYVRKMMGYEFSIEYKKGITNKAADALSRQHEPRSSHSNGEVQGVSDAEEAADALSVAEEQAFVAVAKPIPEVM